METDGKQGVQLRHSFTPNSADTIKKRAAKIDKSLSEIDASNKKQYSNNSYREYKNENTKKHAEGDFNEEKKIGRKSPLIADSTVVESNDGYSVLLEEAKDSSGTWITHEVSTFQQ